MTTMTQIAKPEITRQAIHGGANPQVGGAAERRAPSGILPNLWPAIGLTLVLALITGIVYPLVITGLAQVLFPHQANGSLVDRAGKPTNDAAQAVGSRLIGQWFDQPQYFWPRPSATSVTNSSPSIGLPYNAGQSGGSNLSPTNDTWLNGVKSAADALHAADPDNKKPIPIDLVTASGSGLDPHISVDAAKYQLGRVARIRHLDPAKVQALIDAATQPRMFGVLGENVVNVLALNLALDQAAPYASPASALPASTPTAAPALTK